MTEHTAVSISAAVQNCCAAYNQAGTEEKSKGSDSSTIREKARSAYFKAMPHLTTQAEIRAFIACVAHAMLLDVMRQNHGTKLLYAAQVALGAIPREVRPVGRPKAVDSAPAPTATPAHPTATVSTEIH